MPKDEQRPASPWRVYAWWNTETPNLKNPDLPPRCQSWSKVHPVESEAHGWDVYRALRADTSWLPANATEWGVEAPWRPHG